MTHPSITRRPLPYETRLARRDPATITLAVVHCTELPDLAAAREFGEVVRYPESGTGNAGHFYIDRDGSIEEWIAPDRTAHHVRGCNDNSVGIELVNLGRYPDWFDSRHQAMTEAYPAGQIEALLWLLEHLHRRLPALRWIAGHEELDMGTVPASDDPRLLMPRKRDPGPMFPWQQVLDAVLLERLTGC